MDASQELNRETVHTMRQEINLRKLAKRANRKMEALTVPPSV